MYVGLSIYVIDPCLVRFLPVIIATSKETARSEAWELDTLDTRLEHRKYKVCGEAQVYLT